MCGHSIALTNHCILSSGLIVGFGCLVGPRTHEQSCSMADVGGRCHRVGEEAQQAHFREHRLCGLSLYVLVHPDATCFWTIFADSDSIFWSRGCHVMERESFENEEVARLLNSHFIPIKVDREERPDVDRIYMNYVQATTGSGGWPLNVFITPNLEPVFGGTYWPGPNSNTPGISDQAGFLDILKKISEVWRDQEERCLKSAKDILQQLKEFTDEGNQGQVGEDEGDPLEIDLLEEAYQHFANRYDKVNGGFSGISYQTI